MKVVDNSSFNNNWYLIGRSRVIIIIWYYVNLLIFMNRFIPFYKLKTTVLRMFGAKIGKGVVIKPGVNIKYPWKLAIGDYTWIGEGVWIDNLAYVQIGNNVCISQGAMLLTGNHNYKKTSFDLMIGQISLEDGVWIGAKSIVCPNIICNTHSVLSVGSVANSNLKAFSIYHGIPAKLVRKREVE